MTERADGIIRSLRGMLCAWWGADRVRVPPSEGRLLRLGPGSLIEIDGQMAEVRRRVVGRTAEGPYVLYRCESKRGGRFELRVEPRGSARRSTEDRTTSQEVAVYRRSPVS